MTMFYLAVKNIWCFHVGTGLSFSTFLLLPIDCILMVYQAGEIRYLMLLCKLASYYIINRSTADIKNK